MDSEQIYQALFEHLSGIDDFVVKSRRLRHFNLVPNEQCPALFITQGNQVESAIKGFNPKVELQAEVYIYIYETDANLAPSTQLNRMLDQVRDALKPEYPDMCEYQTLGGLVEHCWIDGTIEIFEGAEGMIDGRGIAIIPIRMLITD